MGDPASAPADLTDAELQAAAAAFPVWYHTIELRPGVASPGAFDLRGIRSRLPWVDVEGLRCLDVGTFDGFWAFEMERRGAKEVIAIDVDDPSKYDWPEILSPHRLGRIIESYDHGPTGERFEFARSALGSRVERVSCSIYDLDPDVLGRFDLVFCSSLLLHLRDPMAALAALRGMCSGHLMTNDPIDLVQTLWNPRRPVARFDGKQRLEWWTPNATAQVRMLESAGFEVVQRNRPVVMPYREPERPSGLRRRAVQAGNRLLTGMRAPGVLQQPILSRPI
jgi:tRNA (mo5U34)-methyltransferase